MSNISKITWYRYEFINSSGREFDTSGVGETHDKEKNILTIDKGDGNFSSEDGVSEFTKTKIN